MFKCHLRLDTEKAVHQHDKGGEVLTLFEAGSEVLLLLLLLSSFQELIGGFGMLGGGVSIHNTHVVNTVHPLCPDLYDEEIPLWLPSSFEGGILSFSFPPYTAIN